MKKKLVLIISLIADLDGICLQCSRYIKWECHTNTTAGSDQLPTVIQTGCRYIQIDRQLHTGHSSPGQGIGHPVESIQRIANQGHKGATGSYRPVNPDQLNINN